MSELSTRTKVLRLKKLRDFIASVPPRKFDQSTFMEYKKTTAFGRGVLNGFITEAKVKDIQNCGTRACIAGWTVLLFEKPNTTIHLEEISVRAQNILGLSDLVAQQLFAPSLSCGHHRGVKARKAAVAVLTELIGTKGESIPSLSGGDSF